MKVEALYSFIVDNIIKLNVFKSSSEYRCFEFIDHTVG